LIDFFFGKIDGLVLFEVDVSSFEPNQSKL